MTVSDQLETNFNQTANANETVEASGFTQTYTLRTTNTGVQNLSNLELHNKPTLVSSLVG